MTQIVTVFMSFLRKFNFPEYIVLTFKNFKIVYLYFCGCEKHALCKVILNYIFFNCFFNRFFFDGETFKNKILVVKCTSI